MFICRKRFPVRHPWASDIRVCASFVPVKCRQQVPVSKVMDVATVMVDGPGMKQPLRRC